MQPDKLTPEWGLPSRIGEPAGRTLTLDLGTRTGWCIIEQGRIIASGTESLASEKQLLEQRKLGKERSLDLRFGRFLDFLRQHFALNVSRVIWEDVQFLGSQCQTQLWASLRSAIWAAAQHTDVALFCVSVPTLKSFATGDPNADKNAMARALTSADPSNYRLEPGTGQVWKSVGAIDDNEVDAIWLARFTLAVDEGSQCFLSAHERRVLEKAGRRSRKQATKVLRKEQQARALAQQRARNQAIRAAIRASGRCCGVLRRATSRGWATCPNCGRSIRVQIPKNAPDPDPHGASATPAVAPATGSLP